MRINIFEGILIPFVGTTLGAACVFFMRKTLSKLLQRALAGFAAGIMVAASIWSLLIPAIKQSENMGTLSFVPAVAGFWIGILFLRALDHLIPHLHVGSEPFRDLLDAGCGPAPMISLLAEKYPDRHYTGLDLTPAMIEQAKKKNIPNTTFVVGDCENFPFEKDSFDAIICSMSFHHYPNPQAFFDSVKRCLRPNGRLILRDVTSDNKVLVWLMNTLEMPLANICGHGDVQVPTRDVVIKCCKKAGLKVEKFEIRKGMRMHCVVRKPMGKAIGNER